MAKKDPSETKSTLPETIVSGSDAESVAMIVDPYGFATLSVQDAQMNDDYLLSEADEPQDEVQQDGQQVDQDALTLQPDEPIAPIDSEALERIEKSVAESAAQDARELAAAIAASSETAELTEAQELARQIAEDQALQQETDRLNAEAEAQREPLPQGLTGENPDAAEVEAACETLLFMSDKPLSAKKIQDFLGDTVSLPAIQEALTALSRRSMAPGHGVELVQVAGGWQFRTKASQSAVAKRLSKIQFQRLSRGAMESLAIIAYKQPILKDEVDKIRGVDSSYFLRLLMDRGLIQIDGRSELPGRPILYSTGDEFLKVFGLKDLQSMPPLAEIESMIPSSEVGRGDDDDPNIKKMRSMVSEMNLDPSGALHYNPREDETLIAEIKERVGAIATSTPTLDEQKAAEKASKELLTQESDKLL